MPRIKRWHPVSHDFNRDPQLRELREKFGDWMGYGWLELLSVADRNDGFVKGDLDRIAVIVGGTSLSRRLDIAAKQAKSALEAMLKFGWIEICCNGESAAIKVVNVAKYHRTQGPNEISEGNKQGSPPNRTRPDPTKSNREARKRANSLSDDFVLNDELKAHARRRSISAVEVEFEKFSEYHRSKGRTFKDWNAAWRNWILRAVEYQGSANGNASVDRAVEKAFAHED